MTIIQEPRIELLQEKKIVGKRMNMSFVDNQTFELWRSFMPLRKEITNVTNPYFYSIEHYPSGFFNNFNPAGEFQKWAGVEVSDFIFIPEGLETTVIPEGKYAVFTHKGPASEGPKTYRYIFEVWLPNSSYSLDERPHFALMGEKYKNNEQDSEEELWIPIKKNK